MDRTDANAPAYMPESSVGKVLQRGGQELLLDKVEDRFAVQASDQQPLTQLIDQTPAADVVVRAQAVPLTEIQVRPEERDQVMQQVRSTEGVDYASHIYRMQSAPSSLIYLTNQITIQFDPKVGLSEVNQIAAEMGLQQIKPVTAIANTFVFELTAAATENPLKIANRLMQRSQVWAAEPNVITRTQSLYRPRDPFYAKQWHLNHSGGADLASHSHIFVEKAWDITRGDRSVVVAIMDDSIDLGHPDFEGMGKIVAPRDFNDNDFLPLPDGSNDNHGTACAGVAVAEENGVGTVGVAPGCALMPIRTSGFLDDDTIESLFGWAMAKGAAVISCSWGPAAANFPLSLRQKAAITEAATKGRKGKGCVIVFAAGNANRPVNGTITEAGWPDNAFNGPTRWLNGFAVHPDIITVSACTSLNQKAAYSNWGPEVSVCGPSNNAPPGVGLDFGYVFTPPPVTQPLRGLGIFTSDRVGAAGYEDQDTTANFGGTSSACPLVAGVAALVLSANPGLTAAEVRQILQQTADKIIDRTPDLQFNWIKGTYENGGRSDWFGFGKVNAQRAVQAAIQRLQAMAAPAQRQIQRENSDSRPIPDADGLGVTSAISVKDAGLVRTVQIDVMIDHPYMGDLELRLIAPTGQNVLLQGRTLGRQRRLKATYTVQTTPLLRWLLNQPAEGDWQLQAIDFAQGDVGRIVRWRLTLGV